MAQHMPPVVEFLEVQRASTKTVRLVVLAVVALAMEAAEAMEAGGVRCMSLTPHPVNYTVSPGLTSHRTLVMEELEAEEVPEWVQLVAPVS